MGVEVKGAGGVVIAKEVVTMVAAVTSRMDNRKSNVSLRTLQRTRRLPV